MLQTGQQARCATAPVGARCPERPIARGRHCNLPVLAGAPALVQLPRSTPAVGLCAKRQLRAPVCRARRHGICALRISHKSKSGAHHGRFSRQTVRTPASTQSQPPRTGPEQGARDACTQGADGQDAGRCQGPRRDARPPCRHPRLDRAAAARGGLAQTSRKKPLMVESRPKAPSTLPARKSAGMEPMIDTDSRTIAICSMPSP